MLLSAFLRYQLIHFHTFMMYQLIRLHTFILNLWNGNIDDLIQLSRFPSTYGVAWTVYVSASRNCQTSVSSSYSCQPSILSSCSCQPPIVLPRHFQPSVLRVVHTSSSEPWILTTLNGGFSCLLQRRLNSRIPLCLSAQCVAYVCAQSGLTCLLTACTAQYCLLKCA